MRVIPFTVALVAIGSVCFMAGKSLQVSVTTHDEMGGYETLIKTLAELNLDADRQALAMTKVATASNKLLDDYEKALTACHTYRNERGI